MRALLRSSLTGLALTAGLTGLTGATPAIADTGTAQAPRAASVPAEGSATALTRAWRPGDSPRSPRPRPVAAAAPVKARPAAPAPLTLGQRAVREAARHAGKPYRWGAVGPKAFDCSGFTRYVYGRLGKNLPHNSAAQSRVVRPVANHAKQVGDLIFTRRGGRIGHVGIYAGNGMMWAAVQSGDVVRLQRFTHRSYTVGRV